jgi:hypothetical protein
MLGGSGGFGGGPVAGKEHEPSTKPNTNKVIMAESFLVILSPRMPYFIIHKPMEPGKQSDG